MADNKSDKEVLLEMISKANIIFDSKENDIIVERGYVGFYTVFTFDTNGNLKDIGAWE